MGIHILAGRYDGGEQRAAFIDSVTGEAFGPLLNSEAEADGFLGFVQFRRGVDARNLSGSELSELLATYRALPTCNDCGEPLFERGASVAQCADCEADDQYLDGKIGVAVGT